MQYLLNSQAYQQSVALQLVKAKHMEWKLKGGPRQFFPGLDQTVWEECA